MFIIKGKFTNMNLIIHMIRKNIELQGYFVILFINGNAMISIGFQNS